MKLPLFYYGHPILRKKADPVLQITDEIRTLIRDMEETMRSHNGLGLSAPQVGKSLAIFLTCVPTEDPRKSKEVTPSRLFINPKLSSPSPEAWSHEEGCLSIPKIYAEVVRPLRITVTAQDIDGKEFTEEFSGWHARAIMHENDHLNGVLYIDRISEKDRKAMEPFLKEIKKKYN